MRQIKFRAWNKEKETYSYVDLFSRSMPSNWKKYFTIEQFTGLKDKNGVEIYSGDIIKNTSSLLQRKGSIVFWEGAFCLSEKKYLMLPDNSMTFLNTCKYWEVIGNIHQDSHLLEGGE